MRSRRGGDARRHHEEVKIGEMSGAAESRSGGAMELAEPCLEERGLTRRTCVGTSG